jgi:YidC/Oxa1 family membrane protein insertase
MQRLQPQVAKLKAKYPSKDDAKQLNQETMKLYKDNNVSLFSGCLPLLVQWPIFLALFTAINNYSPFNYASFLWAPALSVASSTLPLATRFIMPVVVAASTYVQSITSFIPGQDRSQTAFLTYFMPLMLGYWAYGFSIALGLYCALFSFFSAGQQYLVIKRLTKGMAVPERVVKKSAKKK